jgi:hypothetical protein
MSHRKSQALTNYRTIKNFSAFLTVGNNKPESISALSVCTESRDIALGCRYRSWKMRNLKGEVLNMMWSPQLDIIDFLDGMASTSSYVGPAPNPLALFEKQFPDEVKEVRFVALSSSHWELNLHKSVDGVWPLIDFTSLRELAVVVDQEHEQTCVDALESALSAVAANNASAPNAFAPPPTAFGGTNIVIGPWAIPQDLEQNLDALR